MARNFDGTNDNIDFGSNANIDNFFAVTPFTGTMSFWIKRGATGFHYTLNKRTDSTNTGHSAAFRGAGGLHTFEFDHAWSTGARWETTATFNDIVNFFHLAVSYDGSSTANDPVFYINGATNATVDITAPTGTISADAGEPLRVGESSDGAGDLNAVFGWLCYDNLIWTAAEVNRARWWGRPGGGVSVCHPLVTTKLANEGDATADGTATGTTSVGMAVPVVRPGTAMMGAMVGW